MKSLTMLWEKRYFINHFPDYLKLVLVIGLIANNFSCSCIKDKQPDSIQNSFIISDTMMSRIKIDTAKISTVKNTLILNGKIVADENHLVEVYSIVGGNVIFVDVELGDYVKKGQILAIIKSSQVAEYERQLINAQSDVLVTKKNLNIQKDLFDSKLASEKDLITVQKELEKAEAELRRIKETFSIYSFDKQSEYIIKAPINGFIIHKNINRDMILPPDRTENIFTIAELDEVWVLANVYESEIAKIKPGMETNITTLSYPNDPITGKIDKIFNVLDPQTKTMKVRIRLSNTDFKLKPEMLAVIKVKYNEENEMVAIPTDALIFDNSRQYVIIFISRSILKTREVEVYQTTNGSTWITKGIEAGEMIISSGQLFIYDALND